jgi:hypothetical protein
MTGHNILPFNLLYGILYLDTFVILNVIQVHKLMYVSYEVNSCMKRLHSAWSVI